MFSAIAQLASIVNIDHWKPHRCADGSTHVRMPDSLPDLEWTQTKPLDPSRVSQRYIDIPLHRVTFSGYSVAVGFSHAEKVVYWAMPKGQDV